MKIGYCYMMANKYHNVLYVGVTSDLMMRVEQHKSKHFLNSFSAKYNCTKLVWFEVHESIVNAIAKEKQLKAGNRKRKVELIEGINPMWLELLPPFNG